MNSDFKDKYNDLPRPKSWIPGPSAPWIHVGLGDRSLTVSNMQDYFLSQDKKIKNIGTLISSELPETAIEDLGDDDIETKPAAVLVPFVLKEHSQNSEIESLILMTRSMSVSHHKGQVSFPGGMVEAFDKDMKSTALRETNEEIGIDPNEFNILGIRSPVNTRARSGLITPVVATCRNSVLEKLKANEDEVELIHNIEISELVKPGAYFSEIWDFGQVSPTIHMYFVYDTNSKPVFIWGATAHILTDILHCLKV